MGDLSKNFSSLEVMCPCGCGANKISSVLIEKLQKVRNIIGTFIIITSGRNSGKQLVFKQAKDNPKRAEALHGASLPREFHRQDMEKIFKKKIKTRFPILFKRAVEFQMLKARGRI